MSFYGGGGGYPPQQPPTGYPGSGYPQGGGQMPMPGQGAPYPSGGQPPYPGGGAAPYPGGPALPYPSQPSNIGFGGGPPSQPQGFGNAPYPGGAAAPYPSGPSPYPMGSSPYPTGGAPPPQPGYGAGGGWGAQPSYSASPMQNSAYHTPVPQGPPMAPPSQPPGGYQQYNTPSAYAPPTGAMQRASLNENKSVSPAQPAGQPAVYKPKDQGTLKPHSPFSAEDDCQKLRKAMKGLGTDEKAIIDILGHRVNKQRQDLKAMFKTMFGKDLIGNLKSELGGKFEDIVIALMMTPDEFDAYELKRAMKGLGTDEDAMIEILSTRTNEELKTINATYKRVYKTTLEQDIKSDTSGNFERLMVSLSTGGRMENQPVDMNKAKMDAKALYEAGEKKWGTDESRFNAILASQSHDQLRAVFDEYSKITGKTIEKAISSEMSGSLEKGMETIVKVVRNKQAYFAEKLYKSMKGLGTDDKTLVRVMVSRCEIDMVQIKEYFLRTYGKTLAKFITDDTSGHYKRILLAMLNEPY